jgi:hypothetical protein
MQFPKADKRSSTLCTLISSGREFLICNNSSSVVVLGHKNPFLLPTAKEPIILQPLIEAVKTGI